MARLVIVTGDKGGVGKSFLSRSLLDWYAKKQKKITAFDTDKTNSTLFRFYVDSAAEGVTIRQLDTDSETELDELLNELSVSKNDDIVLMDCAARTLDKLLNWMNDVNFFEMSNELNIKITLAFVLAPERDCVAILKDAHANFLDKLDYVVIKNLGKGEHFKIYDSSNVRRDLLSLNMKEIELPALLQKTALIVDELNLPFSHARADQGVKLADRQRLISYSNRVVEQLDKAEALWI